MLEIDQQGMVIHNTQVTPRRSLMIERGRMVQVQGIVVHQTNSSSEKSVFNSYQNPKANGAHFLIAKDGTIYQTASLLFKTNHVGRLRSRCLAEKRCAPADIAMQARAGYQQIHDSEMSKSVPARYPSNADSIGIEIVGVAIPPAPGSIPSSLQGRSRERYIEEHSTYEAVNGPQKMSLQYLIDELAQFLSIPKTEVHRHPDVSYKNRTEASTASWQ
ncbi:N-acetylmuramoyl-L-alanine amidase [Acidovorax sp. GBBC 3334]|uniref:peptidoglycan recognition protein family protein n=1 Tax=Acidovorax sp. GBBC 3334 TaxID=2940496 RepID=UPI002303F949|nr:N-acetylmuramoyl-L-alanine amidase [Acidovorax sp. GBBC 3334]MDA8453846.1 N-acetylmuramoyl-L-alanine amidase [Acidovorax sp. GBBC 3334]